MKRFTWPLLFCSALFVGSTQAEITDASIKELADEVNSIISDNADVLDRRDSREVRYHLKSIKEIFASYGVDNPAPTNLICDRNNNKLVDLNRGEIHDFGNLQNCEEAKTLVGKNSPFCDFSNNTLHSPQGKLIYDFNNSDACRESIPRVREGKMFCDFNDNTLRRPDGSLVYDFSNSYDCRNALD